MPKELNFFDINPDVYSYLFTLSVSSLKDYPPGIRCLYASLCIDVLKHQSRTEPVADVRTAARKGKKTAHLQQSHYRNPHHAQQTD